MDSHLSLISKKLAHVFNTKNEKLSSLNKAVKILSKAVWNNRPALAVIYNCLSNNLEATMTSSIWSALSPDSPSFISKLMSESDILDFISRYIEAICLNN